MSSELSNYLKSYDDKVTRYLDLTGGKRSIFDVKDYMYLYIHHTTALEGNSFTEGETKAFLESENVFKGKSVREHNELLDLRDAYLKLEDNILGKQHLSESVILEYHLESFKRSDYRTAGRLKTADNFTLGTGGEVKYYPGPSESQEIFSKGVTNYLKELKGSEHPLITAANIHYIIARAHPFSDGNGRVARLAFEHVMAENDLPVAFIKKSDRSVYLSALERTDKTTNLEHFQKFIIAISKKYLDDSIQMLSKSVKKNIRF